MRVIRRDFPQLPEADVLAVLDCYGTSDWQRERDRVQLAVLKLANGDFDALRQHTDVACSDYRDVLGAAEYPAYSRHGWRTPFERGERAKTFEADWNQYQAWLQRQ
jgi:hypothetical protein